jgi:osmotically inducible protein OsmC
VGEGFSITGIDLVTKGRVPGADEALFKKVAHDAGEKCIVSRALSVPIKVDATFLGA